VSGKCEMVVVGGWAGFGGGGISLTSY